MVVAQKVKEAEITEQDSTLPVNFQDRELRSRFRVYGHYFCNAATSGVSSCGAATSTATEVQISASLSANSGGDGGGNSQGSDQTGSDAGKPVRGSMRNLLPIAIFNINYIRGLFPENYFNDNFVPALEMKIKKLMPVDAESRRLIDWMEKGVYDALQKKYLKTLLFCIYETSEGPMIDEYAFSFSYSNGDSQEISLDINLSGNKKQGGAFKWYLMNEVTPSQMNSTCKMICTLVQLMRTLDKMPEQRTILMKLLYYDDVMPSDYEPPFFKGCTDDSSSHWTKNPLIMEVGDVKTKHFILALKLYL